MRKIKWWRFRQTIVYGWNVAGGIERGIKRIGVYWDILSSFRKYYTTPTQYQQNKIWTLAPSEKDIILKPLGEGNLEKDEWVERYYENWQFLNKYTSFKWQKTPLLVAKRNAAYQKRYGLGKGVAIQYGVVFVCEHQLKGSLKVGNNVLFAKNVFVDYSGDVTLRDNVKLSDGVIIESHAHEFAPGSLHQYKAVPTTITIDEGVWIGQKAVICESTKHIGRYAQIGAGAVVRNPIPPYAIVVGNPAKIVGFALNPEEVRNLETEKFSDNPIDMETFEKNYEKYLLNRIKEIKSITKL